MDSHDHSLSDVNENFQCDDLYSYLDIIVRLFCSRVCQVSTHFTPLLFTRQRQLSADKLTGHIHVLSGGTHTSNLIRHVTLQPSPADDT